MIELDQNVLCSTNFDKNSDFSTMYLGRIDMTSSDKIMVGERFPYINTDIQ